MTSTLERREAPDLSGAFPTVAWRIRDGSQKLPEAVANRERDFGVRRETTHMSAPTPHGGTGASPQDVQRDEEVIEAYLGEELSTG